MQIEKLSLKLMPKDPFIILILLQKKQTELNMTHLIINKTLANPVMLLFFNHPLSPFMHQYYMLMHLLVLEIGSSRTLLLL